MTQRKETFQAGDRPRVSIQIPSGDVRIVAGDADTIEVLLDGPEAAVSRFTVEQHGDTVEVAPDKSGIRRWSKVDVVVSGPPEMALEARLKSADLDIQIPLRWLRVAVASGDIRARDISGDVDIKTASGDIRLGEVSGRCDVSAASGEIRIDTAGGECTVNSASGDIVVANAADRARFRTAAGSVTVKACNGPECDAKTVSGDVRVGIPAGRTIDVDIKSFSGEVYNNLSPSDGDKTGRFALKVTTVSGDIELRPAS
ncbi:MAG: DUF4097 domain-containing protein [Acidimicrobiia bacterium]|nr:DUF4097 domain-containing protein [Acidimicrobiia bacterium]NNC75310.1 DUF4097 family beta strand repeat protein [Acidimicrobiia bacterium]